MCTHTPCKPLLESSASQTCPQLLVLFVLAIHSVAGAKGFYCSRRIPAHAFAGPAAPLIVVLSEGVCLQKPYLIPPKALQAIQMLTP